MIKIKVLSIEKQNVQESNTNQLSVRFQIIEVLDDQETVLEEQKHGFVYGTTLPEIRNELRKVARAYQQDMETKEANKEFEAQDLEASEVIEGLKDAEFLSDEEDEELESEEPEEKENV